MNRKRALAVFLSLLMVVGLLPTSAMAVEGDAVIADGTYYSMETYVNNYLYYPWVRVTVKDGKFTDVAAVSGTTNSTSRGRLGRAVTGVNNFLSGKEATVNTINTLPENGKLDGVSQATRSVLAMRTSLADALTNERSDQAWLGPNTNTTKTIQDLYTESKDVIDTAKDLVFFYSTMYIGGADQAGFTVPAGVEKIYSGISNYNSRSKGKITSSVTFKAKDGAGDNTQIIFPGDIKASVENVNFGDGSADPDVEVVVKSGANVTFKNGVFQGPVTIEEGATVQFEDCTLIGNYLTAPSTGVTYENTTVSAYVLMNIPYADFYAGEYLTNDVDAVASATKNKSRTGTLAGGSYHVNADGTDISGVIYPVYVKDLSVLDGKGGQVITDDSSVTITTNNRGQESTTTYQGQEALFEAPSYSYYMLREKPAYYEELTVKNENMTFSAVKGSEATTITGATGAVTVNGRHTNIEIKLSDTSKTEDESSVGIAQGDSVSGVVLTMANGNKYGLRHVKNIWRATELGWDTDELDLKGQVITNIRYITQSAIYDYPVDIFVGEVSYALMNIPYADFYEEELGYGSPVVDAVASATKNKSRTGTLAGGSYHVNADGSDISGVIYPVRAEEATLAALVETKNASVISDEDAVSITVTNRGKETTTEYTGKEALFEAPSYSYYKLEEAPDLYKTLTLDGEGKPVFSAVNAEAMTVEGASAAISFGGKHTNVEMKLSGTTGINQGDAVSGVILSVKDAGSSYGSETSYGLRHIANIWRGTELGWDFSDLPLKGKVVSKIRYITQNGVYDFPVDYYNSETNAVASISAADDAATITVQNLPVNLENPTAQAFSGSLTSTSGRSYIAGSQYGYPANPEVTLASAEEGAKTTTGTIVCNNVSNLKPGTLYNVAISSDNCPTIYAQVLSGGEAYVLMNIPYADFYAAELEEGSSAVDAVASATKNKSRTGSLAGGSYHVNADGSDISGVIYPVKVSDVSALSGLGGKWITDSSNVTITVTNRGEETTTDYTGEEALFEAPSYSYYVLPNTYGSLIYKDLTIGEDGAAHFSKISREVSESGTFTGTVSYNAKHTDTEIKLDLGESGLRDSDKVTAVVVKTSEGKSYGFRHIANIWRGTEIGWNREEMPELNGKTITDVIYYTLQRSGSGSYANTYCYVYHYTGSLVLKPYIDANATAVFSDSTTVELDGLPADMENPAVQVYIPASGRGESAVPATYLTNDGAEGCVALAGNSVSCAAAEDKTTYTVLVTSDNYADLVLTASYEKPAPIVEPEESHVWDEGTITREPTCTSTGLRTYTCSDCGSTRTESIPALGHSLGATEAKAATCTEDGNIAYWTCANCGKIFSDAAGTSEIVDTAVPAKGHSMVKTDAVAATESADGNAEYYTCSVCGKIFADAAGSSEISLTDTVITKKAAEEAANSLEEAKADASDTDKLLENDKSQEAKGAAQALQEALAEAELLIKSGTTSDTQMTEALEKVESAMVNVYTIGLNNVLKEATAALQAGESDSIKHKALQAAVKEASALLESGTASSKSLRKAMQIVEEAQAALADETATAAASTVKTGQTSKVNGHTYKVTKVAKAGKTGTVTFYKAKNTKNVSVPKTVKLKDGKTYKVTVIAANAFKGKKIKTVTVAANIKTIKKNAFAKSNVSKVTIKTKKLTKKSVKGCLKGSKVETIIIKVGSKKANQTYVKKYRKLFTKKIAGKKATVK